MLNGIVFHSLLIADSHQDQLVPNGGVSRQLISSKPAHDPATLYSTPDRSLHPSKYYEQSRALRRRRREVRHERVDLNATSYQPEITATRQCHWLGHVGSEAGLVVGFTSISSPMLVPGLRAINSLGLDVKSTALDIVSSGCEQDTDSTTPLGTAGLKPQHRTKHPPTFKFLLSLGYITLYLCPHSWVKPHCRASCDLRRIMRG
jgi:hypothetical protein